MKTAIELAREAELVMPCDMQDGFIRDGRYARQLERLVELARAEEREAFKALEKDAHEIFNNPPGETSQDVRDVIEWYAASIRARGQ